MAENKTSAKSQSLFPILLAAFIDLLGIGIVIPVVAPLMVSNTTGIFDAGVSEDLREILYGLLIASYPIAQFFGAPILGSLSDRYGRKPVLEFALFGSAVGYGLFAVGIIYGSLPILFFSRILDGFTGGNISIVYSAMADLSTSKNKARNFGLIGMMFGIGFVVGPFVGGVLADSSLVSWFSPSLPLWVATGLCIFNLLAVRVMFKETLHELSNQKVDFLAGFKNMKTAFSLPNLRNLFITTFLAGLGFAFFTQFFQVLLIERWAFGESEIGTFFGFIGICIALVQGGLMRPVSKRFRSDQIPGVTLFGLAVAIGINVFTTEAWMAFAIIPLIAIFQGLGSPNLAALVSDEATPEQQGRIMGINQSINSVAIAVPSVLAGFLGTINYNLPTIAAAFFTLLAGLSFHFLFKASRNKAK